MGYMKGTLGITKLPESSSRLPRLLERFDAPNGHGPPSKDQDHGLAAVRTNRGCRPRMLRPCRRTSTRSPSGPATRRSGPGDGHRRIDRAGWPGERSRMNSMDDFEGSDPGGPSAAGAPSTIPGRWAHALPSLQAKFPPDRPAGARVARHIRFHPSDLGRSASFGTTFSR
jgi:hypothetical protein